MSRTVRLATRVLAPASGLLLFLQAALVVTGGAVRLTGSGLGCPTWPECTPGSYTPVPHQAEGQLHAWIEFGNRLLTFVLVFASIAVLIAVLRAGRKDLRGLAVGQFLGIFGQGVLGGITVLTDLNPIPVAGHLLLSIIFQTLNSRFLSGENLANLISQNVPLALIATGSVLMLLIGEIDLSVGVVSGLAASIIISLNVSKGWSPATSIAIGVAVAAAIGLSNGFFVTKFGLPSFVVTLAGLLTWQGVQFTVLRSSGTINIPDGFISSLMSTYLSPSMGYNFALIAIFIYSLSIFNNFRKRKKAGLKLKSVRGSIIKILLLAFIALGLVRLLNSSRGVSGALVFLLIVVSVIDYITRRTRFGRNLFAIGGNLEAASRVGINVKRVKVAVFIIGAILAATGGIFASSRLLAVSTQSGGSDLLLNAIAAAVIGGTSLFGGRGSVWAAILGTLVIGFISNGMDLMNFGSETKLIVTGLVLLAAVSVDSVLRSKYRKRG